MKTPAPASRGKCYLNGMDWFLCALEKRTHELTGAGNASQVALMLAGPVDEALLRERLHALGCRNPVLAGRSRRDPLTLAPYWDMPRAAWDGAISVEQLPEGPDTRGALPPELVDRVNRPLPGRPKIAFTVGRTGGRSVVAMRFDHRLLDAGGAERLLLLLSDEPPSDATAIPLGDRGIHLNRWREKFQSGRVVNRLLLGLRGTHPPVALPIPSRSEPILRSRFVFRTLSRKRMELVVHHAERRVGYLLLLPYLLGACVRAFDGLCRRTGLPGNHYVVPVTLDARRGRACDAIFFNHLSFHFYRFDAAAVSESALLWKQAAAQFYQQTRDRVAEHVEQAGSLMRILPAAWLGRLAGLPLSGRLGSFSFSLLAEDAFGGRSFLGVPIENVYHMPRVPAPPGIGVFFTRHQGSLNLVLSYLEGMLPEAEAEALADAVVETLEQGD